MLCGRGKPSPPAPLPQRGRGAGGEGLRVFRLILFFLLTSRFVLAQPKPPAPNKIPTISAEKYEAQLERAVAQLKSVESQKRRVIKPILGNISQPQKVRRGDGATLTTNGGEWMRRADDATKGAKPNGNLSRAKVRQTREAIETYLKETRAWRTSGYEAPDAQSIIVQLERTKQIRTGPTQWEAFSASVMRGLAAMWKALTKWLDGILPSAPSGGKMPNINPKVIETIFYMTIGALVLLLLYLMWRALRGRIGKRGAKREVRFLGGEDAELLQLPPDELKARAASFAAAGNFREALRHRFISLLVTLDTHGIWRYDTRRTNWEHIATLRAGTRSTPALVPVVEPLSTLTRRFDRVRYGQAECSRDEWMRFDLDAAGAENAAISVGAVAVGGRATT